MEGKGYISVQKITELRAEHKQIHAALPRFEKLLANQSATATAAATTVAAAAAATPTILHATTAAATVDLEVVKPRLPEAFDPTVKRNDVCRFVAELPVDIDDGNSVHLNSHNGDGDDDDNSDDDTANG
ncbi:unnamed protein product [Closterium sp. NIES-53]